MPLVSVLMMFHRVTPFLVPAVRSVLTQTFRDLELVLVDDGCGRGLEPLGEFGRDPRITLVSRATNGGVAVGHNLAVANARGEILVKLDFDDIALPERIERQVAALRENPHLGLVSSRVDAIDLEGRVTGPEFTLPGERDQYVFSAFTLPGVNPSYSGRREIFERCPYRAEFTSAPDYDFFARALEIAPARGLPEVLTHYRHHPQQVTQERANRMILDACLIRLLTARRRGGRGEDFAGLMAEFASWVRQPPSLAEAYAQFAVRALREGFAPLAVYHARKLLSARRDPAAWARATRVLLGAMRLAPGEAMLLCRLFFTGPLKAYRLNPA